MYKYYDLNSEHDWGDLCMYSCEESTKHALLITMTKSGEIRSDSQSYFLFDDVDDSHHKFPNATQIS